ncbi:hypothetical protein Tco_0758206 [Tanacetum coccineum]
MINEKLIDGLFDNHRFNDSLSGVRVGKMKGNAYNFLPRRLVYEAILRKRITRKEDIGGNFKIPCNIGGLKHMNALVNEGSDVNIMPLSTYMKLTDERPIKTDIRLFLASHSYIYPLGIVEDVLVDVAGKDFLDCYLLGEWEIARDAEINPFKDVLVFRRMDKPPKNGDGAWHAKIRLIDPDGKEFTKTLQSIPTTRKLSVIFDKKKLGRS